MARLLPGIGVTGRLVLISVLATILIVPESAAQTADPWEKTNRKIYQFNDYFDKRLVRPAALVYFNLVPPIVQTGVGNFFSNIDDIKVTLNDLLQFKLEEAASDSARVLINSTLGVAGLIDFASPIGLEKHEEDFGQTFGVWGFASGPYLIIPTVGSSNVRDAIGWALGFAFNPFVYGDTRRSAPMYVLERVDGRSRLLAFDELVFGDEYVFVREAYTQRRDYLVLDGRIEDEFGDF